jgi:predicted TIM-barrel fold metal-dependent hydrolase
MQPRWPAVLILLAGCTVIPSRASSRCEVAPTPETAPAAVPRIDHHQHLLSEGARAVTVNWLRSIDTAYARQSEGEPLVDADQLLRLLDEAGIAQALVFSNAYYFAREDDEQPGEYEQAMAENDWTLAQVNRHPGRLFAACSVNPRRRYASSEIERCAAAGFTALKLHFDASDVDLRNAEHVAALREVFATANRLRLPIVTHLQSEAGPFDGHNARIFLTELLPAAPDVPVTVNHLWGGGLYGRGPAAALTAFADAMQDLETRPDNLWFELAQASMMVRRHRERGQLAERMRQIGFGRLLYGSDGPQWSGVPPAQHWDEFKTCMPLTRAELDSLSSNTAPFLR